MQVHNLRKVWRIRDAHSLTSKGSTTGHGYAWRCNDRPLNYIRKGNPTVYGLEWEVLYVTFRQPRVKPVLKHVRHMKRAFHDLALPVNTKQGRGLGLFYSVELFQHFFFLKIMYLSISCSVLHLTQRDKSVRALVNATVNTVLHPDHF